MPSWFERFQSILGAGFTPTPQSLKGIMRNDTAEIRRLIATFPALHKNQYEEQCSVVDVVIESDVEDLPTLMALQKAVHDLLEQAKRNAEWPKEPQPIEDGVITFPLLYYHHAKYGTIPLRYSNPLPMPTACLICDLCQKQIVVGYQCVDHSGERDISSFDVGFSGFDACLPCATKYFTSHVNAMVQWMRSSSHDTEPVFYPHGVVRGHGVSVTSHVSSDGTLHLSITPPGQFVVVVPDTLALSQSIPFADAVKLTEVTYADAGTPQEECAICTEPLTDVEGGKRNAVRTSCGHYFHDGCLQKVRRSEMSCTRQVTDIFRCPLCGHMVDAKNVAGVAQSQNVVVKWRGGAVPLGTDGRPPTFFYAALTSDTNHADMAATVIVRVATK